MERKLERIEAARTQPFGHAHRGNASGKDARAHAARSANMREVC